MLYDPTSVILAKAGIQTFSISTVESLDPCFRKDDGWLGHLKKLALSLVLTSLVTTPALADIAIGVAGPMSGQNGIFGQQMKAGVEAAVASINASGGINGENLVVQIGDDGCDGKAAVSVAQDFASRDVRMVVGHFCSGAALAAATVYAPRGIIMISPSASLPRLTDANLKSVFRLSSRDDAQADFAADRIATEQPRTIAIVHEQGPVVKSIVDRFIARFPSATAFAFKPGEVDPVAIAKSIKELSADVVYFVCSPVDAGKVAVAFNGVGVQPKLYAADPVLSEAFWEAAGQTGEGMTVSFALDHSALPSAEKAVTEIDRAKGSSEGAAIASYSAVQVFAAAAKVQSVNDPAALAAYLRSGAAFETAMGQVSFDAKGDVKPQRFQWYRWSQGRYAIEPKGN
jgi:branched-chain amino acid transport system substrate-binding protein